MTKRIIKWEKIKAEYLQGVTPKELAEKYKLDAKQISDKAYRDSWNDIKTKIYKKTRENIQERIEGLTNIALDALVQVINDPECKNADKVSASRAILDISGLKSLKQEIAANEGYSITINRKAVEVEKH